MVLDSPASYSVLNNPHPQLVLRMLNGLWSSSAHRRQHDSTWHTAPMAPAVGIQSTGCPVVYQECTRSGLVQKFYPDKDDGDGLHPADSQSVKCVRQSYSVGRKRSWKDTLKEITRYTERTFVTILNKYMGVLNFSSQGNHITCSVLPGFNS